MSDEEAVRLLQDESGGEMMVLCKGGPADGCHVSAPCSVKAGMKTLIAGGVYQTALEAGAMTLKFSQEETEKMRKP